MARASRWMVGTVGLSLLLTGASVSADDHGRHNQAGDDRGREARLAPSGEPQKGDDRGRGSHLDRREAQPADPRHQEVQREARRGDDRGRQSRAAGAQEVRAGIFLGGPALGSMVPEGQAVYRAKAGQRQLKVQVEDVNLADGTVLAIKVDGQIAGMITLSQGAGELQLKSNDGAQVPAIAPGSIVTVVAEDGTVLLSGRF